MDIDIKDVLELDDNNEYVVVSKTNYNNQNYYYLIDMKNYNNVKFLTEDLSDQTLVDVADEELLKTLVPLFIEEAKPVIDELKITSNE